MSYVVTEGCVGCKFMDCVEVCPVQAFHAGENFVVINPDTCVDCAICELICPSEAIRPKYALTGSDAEWISINARYSKVWPVITEPSEPMVDADAWLDKTDKKAFLLPNPDRTIK